MGLYKQFCPVAKAMELLDERWTLLIIRELLAGSEHWGESGGACRGCHPRCSPSGCSGWSARVVERHDDGNRVRYALSPAGRELAPVVEALGVWGVRWVGEIGDEDLDPHLLMWDMRRSVDLDAVPRGRTVLAFVFTDVPSASRNWWLVITPDDVDVCDFDPGYPADVTVRCDLRTITLVWTGDLGWAEAVRAARLRADGPSQLVRALPRWLRLSMFAHVPRPAAVPAAPIG